MTPTPHAPDVSDPTERDPAELTTSELLVASRLPLDETGDVDRATRARRLARVYLERRRRRLRQQRRGQG